MRKTVMFRMTRSEATRWQVDVGKIVRDGRNRLWTVEGYIPVSDRDAVDFVIRPWNPLTDGQALLGSRVLLNA